MTELEQNDLNELARHAKLVEGRNIPDIFRLLTSLGCASRAANEAIASIPGVVNIADEILTAWERDGSGRE